jgi:hypothetical protein
MPQIRRGMAALVVVAGAITTLTFSGMAPVSASPATVERTAPGVERGWVSSNHFPTEPSCNASRSLTQSLGTPTQPTASCYRDAAGYYYLYWSA